MMPYQDLSIDDFTSYWCGCLAFRLDDDHDGNAGARVRVYEIEHVYADEIEYDDRSEQTVEGTSCSLVSVISGHLSRDVETMELFDSPAWITHRFQLGYIRTPNDKLLRITAEPNSRRMYKGTSLHAARLIPLLDVDDDMLTDMGRTDMALYYVHNPTFNHQDVAWGVADVLSHGHAACVRRIVPKSVACERTLAMIRGMLNGDIAQRVIVPDFTTALVGHRTITNEATVLTNGRVVGKVSINADGVLVLKAYATKYESKEVRTQARKALTNKACGMYADTVEWVI